LASITTKKGDKGQTSLYGGGRVPKHALRVEAYGELDELGALLGLARALGPGGDMEERLIRLQTELMTLGAVLATPPHSPAAARLQPVSAEWALRMEAEMELFEKALPPLKQFILLGGETPPPLGARPGVVPEEDTALMAPPLARQAAAALHVARAVARRAERRASALAQQEALPAEVLVYLNRLSDWLFMAARWTNHEAGVAELYWGGVPQASAGMP